MAFGIESASLKIGRVQKHLNEIRRLLRDYIRSEADALVKSQSNEQLKFSKLPSDDIPLVAGEIIYQLRSALDHLAFDLVKLNSGATQLPAKWMDHCQFPLLPNVPTKGNPPVALHVPLAYNFFKDTLPGISMQAFAFVESVQPYNGGEAALGLRYLAGLSNIDKHRHLHITKPHAIRRDENIVRYKGRVYHGSDERRLDEGAELKPLSEKLASYPEVEILSVQVDRELTPFVSFDESALGPDAPNLSVEGVLQSCLDAVELVVIPAFAQFLKKP
jgi:hypothetical protein